MKAMWSVLVILGLTLAAVSSCDVELQWEAYKNEQGKNYTEAEDIIRKENFHNTHKAIETHNAGNHSFKMEHNQFSDMTEEERKQYLGVRLNRDALDTKQEWSAGYEDRNLPSSLDYRTDKCLQPVKAQGSCAACWAFAATCPLEFTKCKLTGKPVELSEQELVDCDTNNGGCKGGFYVTAWSYLQNVGGSDKSSGYGPYSSSEKKCEFSTGNIGARVASYGMVESNPTAIMTALQRGPVAVAINAIESFYYYKSGIYADANCSNGIANHALTAVGYGTVNGTDYWVLRNSWGSNWGQDGYVLFERGVNMCSVESYPAYAIAA